MTNRTRGREAPGKTTPAAQWRAGEEITLPGSGHTARLRKPSLRAMLHAGKVPSKLMDGVYRLLKNINDAPDQPPEQQRERFMEESAAFVYVASQCFVEPRLVLEGAPDYDAGEIGPEDLSDLDYIWIFYTWTEGSAELAAPFRLAPGAAEPGLPGPALPLPAA